MEGDHAPVFCSCVEPPRPFQDRAPRRWAVSLVLLAGSSAVALGFALALVSAG